MAGKRDASERRHRQGLLATYVTTCLGAVVAIGIAIAGPEPKPPMPPPPSICELARDVATDADPNPNMSEAVQRRLADRAATTLTDCFEEQTGSDDSAVVAPEPLGNQQ